VPAAGALKVLGIDPGLIATGYGHILAQGNQLRALDFGVIKPKKGIGHASRLRTIHSALVDVIVREQPDEIAIEDFIVGHVRAAVAVGEARAMALLAASQAGLPVSMYKPAEVKQFVTSFGRGSKEQVQMMVQALLELDEPPESPDAADALAVALCHCLKRGSALMSGALS